MKESEDNSSQSEKVIHFGPGQKKDFLRWRRRNHDGYVLNEKQASVFIFSYRFLRQVRGHHRRSARQAQTLLDQSR